MSGGEPLSEEELADLERVGKANLLRYGAELPEDLPETRLTLRLIATIRASQESARSLAEALETMLNRPTISLLDPKLLGNAWLVNVRSVVSAYRASEAGRGKV